MIDKSEFKKMTNNEIKIELHNLELEYEKQKKEIFNLIEKMKKLDALYIEGKNELLNRSKGIF